MKVTILWERWRTRAEGATWFSVFLGSIFKYHVMAGIHYPESPDAVVVLDPQISGLHVYAITADSFKRDAEGLRFDYSITVDVDQDESNFSWIEPLTCVTVLKRLIGLKKFWIWTPKQLLRELLKNGRH